MTRVSSGTRTQNSPSRYEIKMIFNGLQSGLVQSMILGHSHLFKVAYPRRQVNNIYFDTIDSKLKNAHIQGSHQRIKIRLRWYANTWKFSSSQLEIKVKKGNLGSKTVYPIPTEINLEENNWKDLRNTIHSHLPESVQHMFLYTSPVLINNYQRDYYQSADRLIRITMDTQLKSYSQVFGSKPNLNKQLPMRNVCIIEVKSDSVNHLKIASILEEFPQYSSAYSKFLTGTEFIPS